MMPFGGCHLLNWPPPAAGFAVREVTGEPLAFWSDADGALVTGADEGFCRHIGSGGDAWLFADAQGNPEKPPALSNVPEADSSDTQTPVRIVPAGGNAPPITANTPPGTYTVYRIGLRCHRLLLARNVVLADALGGGLVCDFSDAVLDWMAPREEVHGTWDVVRPVIYAEGNTWRPSELAGWDVSCTLAPTAGGIGGTVYPTFSPTGKTQWDTDPVTGEPHRITTDNPPLYVRDYWTSEWVGNQLVRTRHELYWSPTADAAESVRSQLEGQADLLARVFGLDSPPENGTAFDLILLCKTYWWYEKRNATMHKGSPNYGQDVGYWKWFDSGYFNTKLSGYLVQIAPVPPKGRSTA